MKTMVTTTANLLKPIVLFAMIFWVGTAWATTYEVGPGKPYGSILQVPTHNLQAGDSVKVYHQPTPYYEKVLLHGVGTPNNPVVFIGIPDANGNKPIIDGNNAMSNTAYNYFNEDRQVILVGQFNVFQPDYLIVDGFEVRGGNNYNTYTNDQGNPGAYQANACGIRVSWGKNITIRNCEIYGNGNAIQNGDGVDQNLVIEYCDMYDNGVCTWVNSFIHNLYLNSGSNSTVTIQYCRIGELLSNGQQLKSRAQTTVIRYNWIEGGRNSSLDLVEDIDSSYLYASNAFVYGNVIIKPDSSENSRIVHFGADNPSQFRLGTCYFYNNTCIIKDTRTWGSRRIFQLSDDSAKVVADNNIFYKSDPITYDLMAGTANLSGNNNWLSTNIVGTGAINNSLTGIFPNFVDTAVENYRLQCSSPCYNVLPAYNYPPGHGLTQQYVEHVQVASRPVNGYIDLGAFEAPVAPLVALGNDTSINANDNLVLNAGAGQSYLWSTGATTATITITSPPYNTGIHTFWVTVTDQNGCVNSDTIQVEILPATSIYEPEKLQVQFYPNPANEQVTVVGNISYLQLTDINGRILQETIATNKTTLHVGELPAGVYLIHAFDQEGNRGVEKLMVE